MLMKVNVQTLNFNAKEDLLAFVEKRLSKLEQFYDKIISAEVKMKQLPAGEKNKNVEMLLAVPGNEIIVKKVAASYEEAMDETIKAAERQLIKHKQKQKSVQMK